MQASKLVNNSIGQTQLDTTFYDNALYCYNNWRDQSTGVITLSALNPPTGGNGSYYLKANKNPLLTQFTWDLTSNLSTSITLPYNITTNNTGYGSANTANFKLTQNGNSSTSTGIEFSCVNSDNQDFYGSFGFNSSGRYPTTSPNYITYPNSYTYIYSRKDFNLFCYNSTSNNSTIRIQCLPDVVNFWSKCNYNGYNLENVNKIFVANIDNNSYYNGLNYIIFNGECQFNNMIKVDTIQAYSAINQVKFNNPINLQNNKLINYDLEYQTMVKNTSGSIILKTTTNNVYTTWSCYDETDTGIAMGIYKDNNGNSLAYHTINKNYTFGNNFLTLYKIDYNSNNRHTLVSGNMDINMDVNSTIYTNYLRNSTTGYINCYNLKMMTNIDMNNFNLINYSGGGGGSSTVNGPFTVNQGGFLTQVFSGINYASNPGYYYYGNNIVGGFYTNSSNESAHVVGNGDFIQIIQTFDNLGVIFSDEDTNFSTTYQSYINAGGSLIVSSSKKLKYSIREKKNKNYLERLKKVKVYSYAMRYDIDNNKEINDKKLNRLFYKNKRLNIGLVAEEIGEIFENMTDKEKLINIDDDNIDDFKNLTKDKKPTITDDEYLNEKNNNKPHTSINYNVVCCYLIKCFHEQININEKLEDENKLLKNKINDMEDKFNKLLNKLNLTI